MKQDAQTRSRVRSALIYPALVAGALIVLGLVLGFFVLPRITQVFTRFSVELPVTTQVLVSVSQLINARPIVTLLGLGLLAAGLVGFVRSRFGQQFVRALSTQLPLVKTVVWYLDLERFTATLAILVDAGVPIQRGLTIAGRTVTSPALAAAIPGAAARLGQGQSLAVALGQTPLPRTAISLLAAGEQSGTLAANLRELEQFYREHLDEALRTLTALVEPILTLIVGLVVASVVISIIVPIYQLIGRVGPAG